MHTKSTGIALAALALSANCFANDGLHKMEQWYTATESTVLANNWMKELTTAKEPEIRNGGSISRNAAIIRAISMAFGVTANFHVATTTQFGQNTVRFTPYFSGKKVGFVLSINID